MKFFDPRKHADIRYNELPHWQQNEAIQFVTWRLADSVPASHLREYSELKSAFLTRHSYPWSEDIKSEYRELISYRMELWLHSNTDNAMLGHPHVRHILEESIEHFDEINYRLYAYVIMPNHVHILLSPYDGLDAIVKTMKQYSANKINQYLHRQGSVWQKGYFDHLVRSLSEFDRYRQYIIDNPRHLPVGTYTLKTFSK